MKVIKRDGKKVDFDRGKILNAITKAFKDVYIKKSNKSIYEIANQVTDKVVEMIGDVKTINIEDIQNNVEIVLMSTDNKVAKSFITYRYRHSIARNEYKSLMNDIKEKISAENIENQNANVDEYSFGGRMGETTDLIMKRYGLEYIISPMAKNNHINNRIYIHDLSHYAVGSHNCLSIPFDDILEKGFNTRQTDVRPAQSISTAFQLLAVVFQLQSLQQFGGVSATHLDWTMLPYVRKSFFKHFKDGLKYICKLTNIEDYPIKKEICDKFSIEDKFYKTYDKAYEYAIDMTTREVYQAVEGMYHNLNTLQSRSGNQLPFTSINYGTCTEPEGRLIIKALLDISIKGIGKLHKTSIFPCGIFQCMKGINRKEGEPNYDLYKLALKSTALRLYPNYANCDWSGNEGYDKNDPKTFFSTMGKCKLQLI